MAKLVDVQTASGERIVINVEHVLHMAAVGSDKTKITFAVNDGQSLSTVTVAGDLISVAHKLKTLG